MCRIGDSGLSVQRRKERAKETLGCDQLAAAGLVAACG
jgi:hypothetical protein